MSFERGLSGAQNGLTVNGQVDEFGGTLLHSTVLNANAFDLTYNFTANGQLQVLSGPTTAPTDLNRVLFFNSTVNAPDLYTDFDIAASTIDPVVNSRIYGAQSRSQIQFVSTLGGAKIYTQPMNAFRAYLEVQNSNNLGNTLNPGVQALKGELGLTGTTTPFITDPEANPTSGATAAVSGKVTVTGMTINGLVAAFNAAAPSTPSTTAVVNPTGFYANAQNNSATNPGFGFISTGVQDNNWWRGEGFFGGNARPGSRNDTQNRLQVAPSDVAFDTGITHLGLVDLQIGRDGGGATTGTGADLSLARGAGGFRHWVSTDHSGTAAQNHINFWVNTGSTANVSNAPGTGNNNTLSLFGDGAVVTDGSVAARTVTRAGGITFQVNNGDAAKPGGGSWASVSDARSKVVRGAYEKGLAEILKVKPVKFRYTGWGGMPRDLRDRVGVVADQIQKVLPGTVRVRALEGWGDVKFFDPSELTFTLINAVKELANRVAELEAKQQAV